jgi:[acyl-carrier-protein] S-malonyltransferase
MKTMVFMFPGQGSQYVGMGKTLCDKYRVAQETFREANQNLGYDIKKICFNGPHDVLSDTINTQPAILTTTVAAWRVFTEEFGLEPDLTVGHSFGTLSALVCAEAISFTDALGIAKLKGEYAKKYAGKIKSAMIAVDGIKQKNIEEVCNKVKKKDSVFIGIINSDKQIVVSGEEPSVESVEKELAKQGGRIERLSINAPFHTPLMKESAEKTKRAIAKFKFNKPNWPILSSITNKLHKDYKILVDDLYLDLVKPTNWLGSIKFLAKNKVATGIEIGPKAVLKKIVDSTTYKIDVHSFISPKDIEPLKIELKLDKKAKEEVIIAVLRIFASTPNFNKNLDEFEKGAAEPFRQVKKLRLDKQKKDQEPTLKETIWSLEKLKSIIDTKHLPEKEKKERLMDEIFNVNPTLLHIPKTKEIFADNLR